MRRRFLTCLVFVAVVGCATSTSQRQAVSYQIMPLASMSNSSMRGVSVVDAKTVWASGTRGTVLLTTDGGNSWTTHKVPQADSLDFRDIAAFDAMTAYVLSAGEDGRIYKTSDGGATWTLQFKNTVKGAFFDCLDFWDAHHGIALSDPVDGKFLLVRTDDGVQWHELPRGTGPAALDNEAAFASSGTCLITTGARRALIGSGGGAQTHVFVSDDRGDSWRAAATPVIAGTASAGIFSLAARDANTVVAIGGDYQQPANEALVAVTANGGKTWAQAGSTSYTSGAAFLRGGQTVVAVGTKGTRVSNNSGVTWTAIDTLEYNAVQLAADGTGYVVGPRGRIGKLIRR